MARRICSNIFRFCEVFLLFRFFSSFYFVFFLWFLSVFRHCTPWDTRLSGISPWDNRFAHLTEIVYRSRDQCATFSNNFSWSTHRRVIDRIEIDIGAREVVEFFFFFDFFDFAVGYKILQDSHLPSTRRQSKNHRGIQDSHLPSTIQPPPSSISDVELPRNPARTLTCVSAKRHDHPPRGIQDSDFPQCSKLNPL